VRYSRACNSLRRQQSRKAKQRDGGERQYGGNAGFAVTEAGRHWIGSFIYSGFGLKFGLLALARQLMFLVTPCYLTVDAFSIASFEIARSEMPYFLTHLPRMIRYCATINRLYVCTRWALPLKHGRVAGRGRCAKIIWQAGRPAFMMKVMLTLMPRLSH
jgi:hypothetical protein